MISLILICNVPVFDIESVAPAQNIILMTTTEQTGPTFFISCIIIKFTF